MKALQHPNDINNKFIQRLGFQAYLHKLSVAQLQIAKNLENYQEATSTYEKWIFLAQNYKKIADINHPFACSITRTFINVFKQNIIYQLNDDSPYVDFITSGRSGLAFVNFSALFVGEQMENITNRFYCTMYHERVASLDNNNKENLVVPSKLNENTDIKAQTKRRYYRFLKTVIQDSIKKIDDKHHEKYHQFNDTLAKLKKDKHNITIDQLKDLTQATRDTSKVHRDTGLIGFFKCTWARNPSSLNTINKIFDEKNELRF